MLALPDVQKTPEMGVDRRREGGATGHLPDINDHVELGNIAITSGETTFACMAEDTSPRLEGGDTRREKEGRALRGRP